MVLSGTRPLSAEALPKIGRAMKLTESEQGFLEHLRQLEDSEDQETRMAALERIHRLRAYRRLNPREFEVYRYLTRWFYVAIREMAMLPEFRAEAEWIQARLRRKVQLAEITEALEFLKANGFLVTGPGGRTTVAEKQMDCLAGIFRVAMGQYHREMLGLAGESIANTPREERNILGHTFAIEQARFPEAKAILDDALARIRALGDSAKSPDAIYQVELAAFPLTQQEKKSEKKE